MVPVIFSWYVQDLFQVLLSGKFLVPDIFLVFLIYRMTREPKDVLSVVWPAFVGGFLWDLRWTALPGLTAAIYSLIAGVCVVVWNQVPDSGRNARLFLVLALSAQILAGLVRFISWGSSRGALVEALAFQQFSALPVVIVAALMVAAGVDKDNVKR